MSLSEAVEFYTARVLGAQVAPARMQGYDVHNSIHFPGVTFQVKVSRAGAGRKEQKIVKGRDSTWDSSPTWAWTERLAFGADYYVLYGVRKDQVYPFVVPVYLWEDESYDTGNGGRFLRISIDQYSRCGKYRNSFKRNKFWQYLVKTWPKGLLEVVEYYTNYQPMEQGSLFAA
jgi:hypothetical protein